MEAVQATQVLLPPEHCAAVAERQSESTRHWTHIPIPVLHSGVEAREEQLESARHWTHIPIPALHSGVEAREEQLESARHWTQIPPDELVHTGVEVR